MMIDTVGLVRRLPHHLVEAFKSTLEEAATATVILNVCDASDEHASEHLEVTKKLLEELGCEGKPIISVMNKCDKVGDLYAMPTFRGTVMISALEQKGLDNLLQAICDALPQTVREVKLLIPFQNGGDAARLREDGVVLEEEYHTDGLYMHVRAEGRLLDPMQDWIIPD